MKTTKLARLVVTLVSVAAIAAAGTASVRAADPEPSNGNLAATIESKVYVSEDRDLTIRNDSAGEVRFDTQADGGWTVEPASLVLAPGARASVTVQGTGQDGAAVIVTGTPTDEIASRVAVQLTAHVYHERPFDPKTLVAPILGALVALLAVAFVGRRVWLWSRGFEIKRKED